MFASSRAMKVYLARLYLWQARRWRTLIQLLDGAYTGLWLGILPMNMLEVVDELHYRANPTYNSLSHNLSGLMGWEEQAVEAFFQGRKYLAVIGAGAGRELLALEAKGFRVDGFECNHNLVELARNILPQAGAQGAVTHLDRGQAPSPAGYDSVIMGWSSYTLIAQRSHRITLLKKLRSLLPFDAPILLSFFTQPERAIRLSATYQVARWIRLVLGGCRPELGDDLMPLFVHRFTQQEIEEELASAGFRLASFKPEGSGSRDSGWAVGLAV